MFPFSRHVMSTSHAAGLKGDIFRRTIFSPSIITLLFSIQPTVAFFTAVSYCNGSLRKQRIRVQIHRFRSDLLSTLKYLNYDGQQ